MQNAEDLEVFFLLELFK